MNAPRISVLVPTYNCRPFLAQTFDSLLPQLPVDGEVIASDNASDDGTLEVLEAYRERDARVRVFRNATNVGSVANSNLCLSHARAPVSMFVCGDDIVAENAIPTLLAISEAEPNTAVAFGRYVAFRAWPPPVVERESRAADLMEWPRSFAYMVRGGNPVPFSTALFKTENARAVGGLSPSRLYSADYRFWLALATTGSLCFVDQVTMFYRISGRSESGPLRAKMSSRLEVHLAKMEAWANLALEKRQQWERLRAESGRVLVHALWSSVVGSSAAPDYSRSILAHSRRASRGLTGRAAVLAARALGGVARQIGVVMGRGSELAR